MNNDDNLTYVRKYIRLAFNLTKICIQFPKLHFVKTTLVNFCPESSIFAEFPGVLYSEIQNEPTKKGWRD